MKGWRSSKFGTQLYQPKYWFRPRMSKLEKVNCSGKPGRDLMSSVIGRVGSRLRAYLAATVRKRLVPGCLSGTNDSSLATEWVITDGWLRAALTVRRTVSHARVRCLGSLSRL